MSQTDNGASLDTGNGIISGSGVTPAQPRSASDWTGNTRPDQQVSQPLQVQQPLQQPVQNGRWTDEDLERARQQEKDKLYGRIDEVQNQVKTLQQERESEQAERQRLADEASEARRLREEGEMEVRELLSKREQEWSKQITDLQTTYERDRAVFEAERRLAEVQNYRRDRVEQESEYILPELRDFVTGESFEQIDQSIEALKTRTEQIMMNFAAVNEPQQPFQRGATPTAPPVGPMEQMPSYETLTPDDIRGMDMETYKRHRDQLLRASNPTHNRGR